MRSAASPAHPLARRRIRLRLRAVLAAVMLLAAALLPGGGRAPARAQGAPPAEVHLVVPRYFTAGGAGQPVIAQVRDAEGRSVADGTPVVFSASLGLEADPALVETSGGRAGTRMVPATESGFSLVTAVAGEARAEVLVWVRPGPAARVASLLATPPILGLKGRATLEARVEDAFGQPAEGDPVTWSVEGGRLLWSDERVTSGAAAAEVEAGDAPGELRVSLAVGDARAFLVVPVARPTPPPRETLPHRIALPRLLAERPRR